MNQKRIEKLIPIAMREIEKIQELFNGEGKLLSNYSGYIDSFGPTVRQSGLMQAVSFNEKNQERQKINKLLFNVLTGYKREVLEEIAGTNNFDSLLGLVKKVVEKKVVENGSTDKKKKLESLILEVVVACKLAMRTFPKEKVEESK